MAIADLPSALGMTTMPQAHCAVAGCPEKT